MNYVDFYFRAPNENAMNALANRIKDIVQLRGEDEEGNKFWTSGPDHAFDPIGVRYTPGEFDAEGEVIVAPEPMEGWWANLRVREDLAPAIQAELDSIPPQSPFAIEEVESTGRVWL